MSASFHLQLDTHAPVITWGATGGATAGELLQVGYTIDEPALVSATIRLADGRILPLTDTGLTLEVLLPADTPDGNATISALVRDDVLNRATRTRVVHLTGTVIIPEEPPTSPGWPTRPIRRPRRPQPTVVRSRTSARARTRSTQTAKSGRYVATGVATSSQRMSAAGAPSSSTALATAGGRRVGELVATASSRTVSRGTVRRRDGDLEALVALGLI